ncbi:hypothetical protein K491DRAFT_705949 [Lophiostoma macrostomum CBS 122681]|uniref:Uncharacterized protein n=1 Tax=Lophiostoma macrostomum CBS 122681 TaxID=1314788 RepID=A0A6A6SZS1_9PLEO|nr:hypothetical protein K491DRAFT_705949 [Lophiostoma macrostomum CBS 122681]
MPKPTKRASKALPAASNATTIPPPFAPAPGSLAPLLSTFDKSCVYITHIDPHPAWFKKRVFLVPVGLNITIALLLLWRAYAAAPWYWGLLMSILGNHNESTVFFAHSSWGTIAWTGVSRGAIFMMDWLLFSVVGPWPYTFFLESPGNPVRWRWSVGFRDEEVYVRQSRGWGAEDLLGEAEGASKARAGESSPFFKTRVLPAVDAGRLRSKTGYMLMDKDFDLDFAGMVVATRVLDSKEVEKDELRKSVFVWVGSEEEGQWVVWNCWRLDEGSETEARQKIVLFKDRLTAMGKENLFFRWVELVQYESNAPGGFTKERQAETAEKAKRLFEEQGVDFETFSREIGGLEGMPGMT